MRRIPRIPTINQILAAKQQNGISGDVNPYGGIVHMISDGGSLPYSNPIHIHNYIDKGVGVDEKIFFDQIA